MIARAVHTLMVGSRNSVPIVPKIDWDTAISQIVHLQTWWHIPTDPFLSPHNVGLRREGELVHRRYPS
jgi:hypothetical protein